MRIEKVELDGFKSYSTKTDILDFHPQFNAITGLNGTGKSNILDSICFVLGIQNLSQVRVQNLQELVYKQGQAGVNKATVTITFNNEDKKSSPTNYENFDLITVTRQIVIGGRNRYFINGKSVLQNQIHEFFMSVHLNVNNPHFLIMQGRVTKVINMKPPEVLSLIEEAAGTRAYETKRSACLTSLAKKDEQLEQVDKMINESISPAIEKLRKEKTACAEHEQNEGRLEQLRKFQIVFSYYSDLKRVQNAEQVAAEFRDKSSALQDSLSQLDERRINIENELVKIAHEIRNIEDIDHGALPGLKQKEKDALASLQEVKTKIRQAARSGDECKERIEATKKLLDSRRKELIQKEKEFEASGAKIDSSREALEVTQREFNLISKALRALSQGADAESIRLMLARRVGDDVSNGDRIDEDEAFKSAVERIIEAKNKLGDLQAELKAINSEISDFKETEKRLVQEAKQDKTSLLLAERQTELQSARDALATCREQFDPVKYDFMESQRSQLIEQEGVLLNESRTLRRTLHPALLSPQYRAHVTDDMKSGVYGTLLTLLTMSSEDLETYGIALKSFLSTAIVVQSDEVASKLISSGGMQMRCTFLPLNTLRVNSFDEKEISAIREMVQNLGGCQLTWGLEIIKPVNEDVKAAIDYFFGRTLIASDEKTAKLIAFEIPNRQSAITLDGTYFDARGQMSGGSSGRDGNDQFKRAIQCILIERELGRVQAERSELENQLESPNFQKRRQEFLHKERETQRLLNMIKGMSEMAAASGGAASAALQLDDVRVSIQTSLNRVAELKSLEKELDMQVRTMETARKSAEEARKKLEKELLEKEKKSKLARAAAEKAWSEVSNLSNMRDATLSACKEAIRSAEDLIAELQGSIIKFTEEVKRLENSDLKEKIAIHEAICSELKALDKQKKKMEDTQIQLEKEKKSAESEIASADGTIKKWESELKKINSALPALRRDVEVTMKKNSWLMSFDVDNNKDYQSELQNSGASQNGFKPTIEDLERSQAKLRRVFDSKAIKRIFELEERHKELTSRRTLLQEEKENLNNSIIGLDIKKKLTVEATYEIVNLHFSNIFSSLLPGAMAQLVPVEEGLNAGLDLRVGFNGFWKEGLTELSGGQRSLLALSLILALLKFKPAPLYILDEVDAALDVSHTANIGRMIRDNFPNSQFIVVSLKEGMFHNADVLFSTRFENNVSKVIRTVNNTNERSKTNLVGMGADISQAEIHNQLLKANGPHARALANANGRRVKV